MESPDYPAASGLDMSDVQLPMYGAAEQQRSQGLTPSQMSEAEPLDIQLGFSPGAMRTPNNAKAACLDMLLQHLAQLTSSRDSASFALPPDFRVQLQLMEFVAQQGKLLQQVHQRVEEIHEHVHDQLGMQLGVLQSELRQQLSCSISEALAHKASPDSVLSAEAEAACQLGLLRKELREELNCSVQESVAAAMATAEALPRLSYESCRRELSLDCPHPGDLGHPGSLREPGDVARAMDELNHRIDQIMQARSPLADLSPVREDIRGILSNTLEGQNLMQRLEDRLSQKMGQVLDAVNRKAPAALPLAMLPQVPKAPSPATSTHFSPRASPSAGKSEAARDAVRSEVGLLFQAKATPSAKSTYPPPAVRTDLEAAKKEKEKDKEKEKEKDSESVPLKDSAEDDEHIIQEGEDADIDDILGAGTESPKRVLGKKAGTITSFMNPEARENARENLQKALERTMGHEAAENWWLHRMVCSPAFDAFCTLVILTNAFTIGITTQWGIQWAVENVNQGDPPANSVIQMMDRVYIGFYLLELLLKLSVWRADFFFNKETWKWNAFDLVLVLFGIYDFLSEFVDVTGGLSITWLRMMRLLKTMKMLRVVRVMRFFRVLRTMLSNVVASMATLFWSVLMLCIIMYMFGLVFVQGITSYLGTTPLEKVETYEDILSYWSGVGQSTITLYLALTGGADWEQLAAPIKEADIIFYFIFMCYIAFAGFAVLNVVTGMVVDNAMKVSAKDESSVCAELNDLEEVIQFRQILAESNSCDMAGFITLQEFIEQLQTEVGREFMRVLEMDEEACKHVFKMIDIERSLKVDQNELINGCLHGNSNMEVELSNLVLECKKSMHQQAVFMDYMQSRMDEVLQMGGATHSEIPSIQELLRQEHINDGWNRQSSPDAVIDRPRRSSFF
mmetsp:Transcript_3256/g.6408  ORF Transcript_3256/g.6408 Transcript_3256/m.6408 type:complete len:906 (+) Transcript_3256:104-2821(+)